MNETDHPEHPRSAQKADRWFVSNQEFELYSAFQPIFSLAHGRLIGHEALLRASDMRGQAIGPQALFAACSSIQEQVKLDRQARQVHLHAYGRQDPRAEWLFLNVHSRIFDGQGTAATTLLESCRASGIAPQKVVVELLEDAIDPDVDIVAEIEGLRSEGFLVAIDDFGAGHSNFDRVFALSPNIVKLDRCVIARAAANETVRRVVTQMVSLLHECGALVLMEGVERNEEALIALDADVDFVQGYLFGRPQSSYAPGTDTSKALEDAWMQCEQRWDSVRRAYQEQVAPYLSAASAGLRALLAGVPAEEAFVPFLALPDAELCYLLDASGYQVGANFLSTRSAVLPAGVDPFAPLRDSSRARWSRRPYFRRAMASPGSLQTTRPYLTMQTLRMCVTFSACIEVRGATRVVCFDMAWTPETTRPDFAATMV